MPILGLQGDKLFVNLHPTIPLLIREARYLIGIDAPVPIVARTLLGKQSHFDMIKDCMNVRVNVGVVAFKLNSLTIIFRVQALIKLFLETVKRVKLEVRPLFLPQLVQLTSMLKPGLNNITVRTNIA